MDREFEAVSVWFAAYECGGNTEVEEFLGFDEQEAVKLFKEKYKDPNQDEDVEYECGEDCEFEAVVSDDDRYRLMSVEIPIKDLIEFANNRQRKEISESLKIMADSMRGFLSQIKPEDF